MLLFLVLLLLGWHVYLEMNLVQSLWLPLLNVLRYTLYSEIY